MAAGVSPDTVANDPDIGGASGGGLYVASPPSTQNIVASVVGDHRGGPDVSMSGDLYGGFEMYSSFSNQSDGPATGGWTSVGGTSESAPLFAGIAAIIDQATGRSLGPLNPYLYAAHQLPDHGGLVPVTSGNNTVTIESSNGTSVTVPGYEAITGYNLATGSGTGCRGVGYFRRGPCGEVKVGDLLFGEDGSDNGRECRIPWRLNGMEVAHVTGELGQVESRVISTQH